MNGSQDNIGALLQEILKRVSHEQEYLTIDEVAARLKCSRRTIANRVSAGIYQEGVHFFRPEGMTKSGKPWHCDPLFKWSSIVAWVEGEDRAAGADIIPMRKGYGLR
jgi:hypothetical protein